MCAMTLVSASKLVAFVNSKGGVGKSTIAVHYAVAETERGRRVALIDSDVQESSTRWLKELTDGISVYRLPTPDDVLEEAPKLKGAIRSGDCRRTSRHV
jgi:cellulose biosynthesis protein BcsQ